MTDNSSTTPASEFPASEGWPDYPGFGSVDDVIARMHLLDWIRSQIDVTIRPEVGDYILATDGRILGFGPDSDELFNKVVDAEPALKNARIVVYRVPPCEW